MSASATTSASVAPDGAAEGEEPTVDAARARARRFDPDLWVIEVEDRDGRHLLEEPGLSGTRAKNIHA